MWMMFSGAIVSEGMFGGLTIEDCPRNTAGVTWHRILLRPSGTVVYATADRAKAERYIAAVRRALKRGISLGVEWIDLAGLPDRVEYGSVELRRGA